jgi:hypothetical protein
VALALSLVLHLSPLLAYQLSRLQRPPPDDDAQPSAGLDSWGVDVALEPSEGSSPSEAQTSDDGPAAEKQDGAEREAAAPSTSTDEAENGAVVAAPRRAPPKRQRKPATVAARASAAGAAGPLADSSTPASSAPGIGSAERSSLLKDFVWVVSSVNARDDAWHRLPAGPAGKLRLRLTLNVEGRIVGSSVLGPAPEHLERLWGRTRLALARGRFAPRPESATAEGQLELTLEARVLDEAAEQSETADPLSPVAYSQTPPTRERPGRAYFRFPSGRAVEILVREAGDARKR